MLKSYLGTINIFISDRHNLSVHVNQVLTENGHLIMARLGVNIAPKCDSDCLAIISLVVCGLKTELDALKVKLDRLAGIKAILNLTHNK
jgi:hypothetical protein